MSPCSSWRDLLGQSHASHDHGSGRSPGYVTSISTMVFEKSEELFVMNRSAPTATAVARCTASAGGSPWAAPSEAASSAMASSAGRRSSRARRIGEGLDLGLGMVTHRLDEQLWDQEHRPGAGNRAGLCCRLGREEGPDAPAEWVTRYRRIDQDVCVEGVHRVLRSARRPSRRHVGDELLGPFDGHVRGIGESGGAPTVEEVAESLSISEGPISSTNPNGVGANDHRHCFAVAGDGHFLTGEHTVEDLGQRSPSFTGGHRGHGSGLYCDVQVRTTPHLR